MQHHLFLLSTAFLLAVLTGCSGDAAMNPPSMTGTPVVYTTFYPTTYFAERIGGDAIEVVCPVPADADPIFWMPEAETIAKYQQADLIILNGAGFEKWVETVALPQAKVVDTAWGFHDRFLTYEGAVVHSHGPGGEHTHEGMDGHTWLDPELALRQAQAVKDALVERFADDAEAFEAGFQGLAEDLKGLAAQLEQLTEQYEGQPILCSHPAYNYLAARHGWKVRSLDLDPDEVLEDLGEMKSTLAEFPARHILWESAPRAETVDRLQELGLTSVVFSPCEQPPEEGDYLSVMRENLLRLAPVLAGGE